MHLDFGSALNRSKVGDKGLQYMCYNLAILNEIVRRKAEGLNPAEIHMVSAKYGTPRTKENGSLKGITSWRRVGFLSLHLFCFIFAV
jgi:hypothetical protein